jgi:Rieske Fe-S protein
MTALLEVSMTDNRVHKTAGDASRRTVMSGIVGVGVGVPLLAACGSDDSESSGSGGGSDSGGGSASASGSIGKTSEVPVGGAKIFKAEKVVVSQPSEGEFKAFSTVCTHQGCPITKLDGDEIECSCHGSRFMVADGSVANGPATKPLEELKATVKGDNLSVS